jgi:hypothetical protein
VSSLDAARERLAQVRAAKLGAEVRVRDAQVELRRLRRLHPPRDRRVTAAEAELARAEAELERIRGGERAAGAAIARGLAELIRTGPADDVAGLDTEYPIVLMPVRLETRFFTDPAELRLRVYPDALAADQHDEALTATEQALAQEYWRTAWDPPRERDAWRVLLGSVGAPRAAWIVRAVQPTNLAERPAGAPVFPTPALRPEAWSRATETRLLPDRWIVLAYRDGVEVRRGVGPPIRDPLALTLAPDAPAGDLVPLADGISVDADFAWAFDFARAEEAGMALRLPLGGEDTTRGFDRLLVLGVKRSLPPERGGARLAALVDSQHYSRGFELVRQGTPTNNTEEAPSGYPPPDPDHSFDVERAGPLVAALKDGALLAAALGVPATVMDHIDGAGRTEQRSARAMNEALWPATLGYFLEQMLAPLLSPAMIAEVRRHFLDHVRGRGPLPAIRTGATPYGILPVTSVQRWPAVSRAGGFAAQLPELLRRARRVWLRLAAGAPRVGATADADADLLAVLGMDASSRVVRIREVLGPAQVANLALLLGVGEVGPVAPVPSVADELGLEGTGARILSMVFADNALRYRHPLVVAGPLSEDAPLASNYIRWIRQAATRDLLLRLLPRHPDWTSPLLSRMLRHGALALYARLGHDLEVAGGLAVSADVREPELVGIVPGTTERPTLAQRLARPIPAITGTVTLGDFLTGAASPLDAQGFRAALQELENLPTAELQRLFTETLDVCSSRLDAWITSLATGRLAALRERRPLGCHVGAYGWVEDLRPREAGPASGGFVQAPSMSHAAAAAVLRNAFLGRQGEAARPVKLDLSSARVRQALVLFDGVRQGQPLGALLGYRLERTLHERNLDRYIEPLRRLFPLAAEPPAAFDGPTDRVPARNVVDGLALRNAAQADAIPFTDPDLPASGPDRDALMGALQLLDDTVDAAADLLMAESVYRAVRGQVDAAAATLSSAATGDRMPEPEVVQSPRGGINITHRVSILFGEPPPPAPGWSSEPTPRAAAEPRLDAWIGTLLGSPSAVLARLSIPDPAPGDPDRRRERVVRLAELGLRPIDVVFLEPSEVIQRLRWVVRAEVPDLAAVAVDLEADPAWDRGSVRTFPEILEIAVAIRATLAGARALEARDLVTAGRPDESVLETADLQARDAAVRIRLDTTLLALREAIAVATAAPDADPAPLTAALLSAALFGVTGAFAPVATLEQVVAEEQVLAARLAAATAAPTPLAALTACFGPGFMVLPRLTPPNRLELGQALAFGPTLVGDPAAVAKWFQRMARVRPALGRLRRVTLTAEPLGAPPAVYQVAQLPHDDTARWAALPFVGAWRPGGGTVSLVVRREFGASPAGPLAGVLVDEWVELIPADVQNTGIAVHFDDPGAEAPQAVLVAVPPPDSAWSLALLADIVGETLDLARIRAVDTEALGDVARLLPAVYLASNIEDDTVSTDFRDFVIADPTIRAVGEG